MRRFAMTAALYLVFGLWALVAPQSFFDQIATYPPYNKHFVVLAVVLLLAAGAAVRARPRRTR